MDFLRDVAAKTTSSLLAIGIVAAWAAIVKPLTKWLAMATGWPWYSALGWILLVSIIVFMVVRRLAKFYGRVSVLTRLYFRGLELKNLVGQSDDTDLMLLLGKEEHDWRMDCVNAVTVHIDPAKGFWLASGVTGVPHVTNEEAGASGVEVLMPNKKSVVAWRIDETLARLTPIVSDLVLGRTLR